MHTRVTELLGVRYPIVQGGLQSLALPELCAAVSNAGALGQLTAAAFATPADLVAGIERTRALTDKPFGVNLAVGHFPLDDHFTAALDLGIRIFTFTAGNPEPFVRRVAGRDVCTLVPVTTVRHAQKAESIGVSAVIAVGYEGGGHIGLQDLGTMVLVPRLVDSVKVPVLAAGGIGDARGFAAALALGAEGIEMGTRFVATVECPAHPNYKQALVKASESDTIVVDRSIGRPARVLRGPWAERLLEMDRQGAPVEAILPLIGREVNFRAARDGDMEQGFVWAGQVCGMIDDVPPVAELIERVVRGASGIAARLPTLFEETGA